MMSSRFRIWGSLGVPVLTRDGEQFGILEHVLQVPEEDLFKGIVIRVGGGTWADRQIQRDLSRNHVSVVHVLEALRPHHLRFVPANQIAAITVGYIRCDLDGFQVSMLQPPSGSPAIRLSDFNQQAYGSIFGMTRGTSGYRPLPPAGRFRNVLSSDTWPGADGDRPRMTARRRPGI